MTSKVTKEEVAKIIEDFLEGTGRPWDWDGFEHMTIADVELARIQDLCIKTYWTHPATEPDQYCNEQGLEIMRQLVKELRGIKG